MSTVIRRIVDSSLKIPLLVAALVLGLFSLGFVQLREMPIDTLPDFTPVYVEVQTESLGLSAVEVEQLITAPMEQILLNGVPWLEEISSESIPGLSSIVMVFEPGTDPLEARQVVQERLSQGRDLPRVAKAPVMLQPLSSTSRVMMVRVDSDELSPVEQSVLAKWTIKPALMGVTGVANVAIWGQREQQMQVQVDPERLAERGVTLNQVLTSTANALWVSPLSFVEASTPGTGGFIDTPNQRLGIHHILPITEPQHLASVALEGPNGQQLFGKDGKPVLLGDVVSVVEDHQPLIGDAVAGESQGLMLVIEKFPEANALEVTKGVESTMAVLAPGLTGVEFRADVFRPASYIDMAIDTLTWLLLLGLALMLLVLVILHGWRLAVVAAVTVPLSLVAATLVLYVRGETFNHMLLAGLMVATIAIVDDAVIDFDNVRRRLREADLPSEWRAVLSAAVHEMRRPIIFATLIMLAATVPLFYVGFRSGLDGDFFGPIVLSYALALLASLVIALVVAPVMSMMLVRGGAVQGAEPSVPRRLASMYSNLLTRGLARPVAAVSVFGMIALAGLAVAPVLEPSMKPELKERTLLVHWQAAAGTSHPEMSRITSRVAAELRQVPGVENVGAHVGRALSSDEVSSVNVGELWASLTADADHDQTMGAAREVVSGYPGIEQEVLTYTDERITAHGIGSPTPEDVVVRVFGQEYELLAQKAREVQQTLAGIGGVRDVTVGSTPQEAQIEVRVDLDAAQQFGLTPGEVRRAAATLVSGIEVGSLFEQQKVFEVIVLGTPQSRHDLSAVEALMVDSSSGQQVRLGDVAKVQITSAPTTVRHSAVSRYVDVVARVGGRDVADVALDAEVAIEAIDFPLEYHSEILGDYAQERTALMEAFGFAAAALVAMFLLFQAYLGSWRLAVLAFIGLPLAISGGIVAAALAGIGLSIGTLLGVLVIVGLYTRNLLTLFGRYQALVRHDRHRPDIALVVRGASERFLSTFVAAVAVAAMLLPLVVLGSAPGLELLQPMSVVALGGLISTTFLSLFLLPLMYLRIVPDADAMTLEAPIERHPATPTVNVG